MTTWKPQWTPLYDMRFGAPPFDIPPDRFLAVSGRLPNDGRHTLGVPAWLPTVAAVKSAKRLGWLVHGVWRKKEA